MISYIGGKSKISNFIIPYYPKDIETYVETFSGMFWCFFKMDLRKYPNLKTIVYNDINPLNVNLFKCVRNHKELLKECNKLDAQEKGVFPTNPVCKKNFDNFQKEIFSSDFLIGEEPNYEVAAKYAYILTQVWSGTNPEKGKFIDLKGKYTSKFDSFKNKLNSKKWQAFFEKITVVENLDFEDVIKKYDSSNTYFYCDPPYYKTENYYANHEFGITTHERLANVLKSIDGKFSLSYYYFDNLTEWFPSNKYAWANRQFAKASMATAGKLQSKATELLIMNY
jgi:DNA adenine methylase